MPPAGEPRSGCPINATIEVLGDRWSLLVLRDVMFGNRRHFRELQKRPEEGIASNILADRLRRLVAGVGTTLSTKLRATQDNSEQLKPTQSSEIDRTQPVRGFS